MKIDKILTLVLMLVLAFSGCSMKQNELRKTELTLDLSTVRTDSSRVDPETYESSSLPETTLDAQKTSVAPDPSEPANESTTRSSAGDNGSVPAEAGNPSTSVYGGEKASTVVSAGETEKRKEIVPLSSQLNTAQSRCTVVFEDYDGTVLKKESIVFGGTSTPPMEPSHIGYRFTGWNGIYRSVRNDT